MRLFQLPVVLSACAAALLLLAAPDASAQRARNAAPVQAVAGVDLTAFAAQVSAAATAAGVEAPSAEVIRAEFTAVDTNGDGTLSSAEVQARGTPSCSDRGVCIHGACFCVDERSGPDSAREDGSVATDNAIHAPNVGALNNVISE